MTQPAHDSSALQRSLERVRITVLIALAALAAFILSQTGAEQESIPSSTTWTALTLALGSTVMRRLGGAPATPPRLAVLCALSGMLLALAVGGLGVVVSQAESARETGLLFTLGAFILALPRPTLPSLSHSGKH